MVLTEKPNAAAVATVRPRARLVLYLCFVGTLMGVVCWSQRRLSPASVPEVPLPDRGGGTDALRRARLLYERLMPGKTPPLTLLHHYPKTLPDAPNQSHRPARDEHDRHGGHDAWMVRNKDEDSTAAFKVTFDARTGALQSLIWAVPGYALRHPRPEEEGAAAKRELLDSAPAAISQACRVLRRLGIPEADGPWKVGAADRSGAPGFVGQVWRVNLSSARWSVWSFLDPARAELLGISICPAVERRHDTSPSSGGAGRLVQKPLAIVMNHG